MPTETTNNVLMQWRADCPELQKLWLGDDVTKWVGLTFDHLGPDGKDARVDTSVPPVLLKIHLTDRGLTSIPDYLGKIKTLSYMNFCDNKLLSLPASLGSIDWMTYLDVERNQLRDIPPELGDLTRLKTLHPSRRPTNLSYFSHPRVGAVG